MLKVSITIILVRFQLLVSSMMIISLITSGSLALQVYNSQVVLRNEQPLSKETQQPALLNLIPLLMKKILINKKLVVNLI